MRKLDSNAHSVFLLYYHLILVIKYRKKILTNPVSERAREIFEYIAPGPSEIGTQQIYQCV